MNRISDLHIIVRVSNICNQNGLIKEADQLLNIFTKLAQENPDLQPPAEETSMPESLEPETPTSTSPKIEQPDNDQDLIEKLNDFITSSDQIFKDLVKDSSFEETKQLLPELTRIIDLARVILNNPQLDEQNKKTLTDSLPSLIKIQESLKA